MSYIPTKYEEIWRTLLIPLSYYCARTPPPPPQLWPRNTTSTEAFFHQYFAGFLDKKRQILNFTLLQWVLWEYCKNLILPYKTRFLWYILIKIKVVPLSFFSKLMFSKWILRTSILRKKNNWEHQFWEKRKGTTLVLIKMYHKNRVL